MTFLPIALGSPGTPRVLNLYRQRGASSLFEADTDLMRDFGREQDYTLDATVRVPIMSLDEAATKYGFEEAVYLKLDVQGTELDILRSGSNLLTKRILAIRTEVEFIPVYKRQPLFSEVELFLRDFGFEAKRFIDLQHWRRLTRKKHPALSCGPVPYSHGQLVHGDVLFLRRLETIACNDTEAVRTNIKAAFLALCYGHVEEALILLSRPPVQEHLLSAYGCSVEKELAVVSMQLARQYRRDLWDERRRHFMNRASDRFGGRVWYQRLRRIWRSVGRTRGA